MLDIIVAEDDRIIRCGIVDFIDGHVENAQVVGFFADGSEVIDYLRKHSVDIIVTDIKMHDVSGLEIAKYVYEHNIKTAVIIISAYREFDYAQKAIDYNACAYLLKPIMPKELRSAISRAQRFLSVSSVGSNLNAGFQQDDTNKQIEDSIKEESAEREELLMERALEYIHKNYNKDISLADVAAYVYLSEHYFGSIFKRNKKVGFVKYLNNLRIEEAICLLKTGSYSVKEISTKVGFRNCNYFIKLFKTYTNVTPKQYCLFLESKKDSKQ